MYQRQAQSLADQLAVPAAQAAAHLGIERLRVIGDSLLVVKQAGIETFSKLVSLPAAAARPEFRLLPESELCLRQVQGRWQCKHEGLVPLLARVQQLQQEFETFSIEHVLRCGNASLCLHSSRGLSLCCRDNENSCPQGQQHSGGRAVQ